VSGICPAGELVGGDDPLVCRRWYDPTPCLRPSVKGPFTQGEWYRWTHSQKKCGLAIETLSKAPPPCPHAHLADLRKTVGLMCLDCGDKL
jgi:hypothetical protein